MGAPVCLVSRVASVAYASELLWPNHDQALNCVVAP